MQHFTNETIDLESLPKYEETALAKPDAKYWNVILINLIIFLAIIGIGLSIIFLLNDDIKPSWMWCCFPFIGFAGFLVFLYRISFKRRGYALRENDVIYKSGVIAETTTIVPLNRIQHVALNEGLLSRMFQLGTLQIYTAGGSSGEIRIAGIPIAQAKTIKAALVQRVVKNLENEAE